MGTPKKDPIGEYLSKPHRELCGHWVFSGDRKCTCGRDQAISHWSRMGKLLGIEQESNMKVIVIGGYPGSGKSTIVKEVIHRLIKDGHKFTLAKYGKLVTYMKSNKDLIILGNYQPDELFPGTDRFPMNVQPEAIQFLMELQERSTILSRNGSSPLIVLFEGDRLFNGKMLTWLQQNKFDLVLCIVSTLEQLLETRRNKRSKQNETWRKGRATKVDRIAMEYPVQHRLKNNTQEDFEQSVKELLAEIKGEWKSQPVQSKIKDLWR